uniref:Integrase_H2C2 domain-containing protein n=1 Tax=Syphacia muris TaxID=451379 RepID=A0A0N5B1I4_9BILA
MTMTILESPNCEEVIDFTKTKRWEILLNHAINIQQAIVKFRKGNVDLEWSVLKKKAKIMLIRESQKRLTSNDIEEWDLQQDEDGIWKVSGRFELQMSTDKPIYLPCDHPIVTMLVLKAHRDCGHFGVAYTLSEFRKTYWIKKGRSQ